MKAIASVARRRVCATGEESSKHFVIPGRLVALISSLRSGVGISRPLARHLLHGAPLARAQPEGLRGRLVHVFIVLRALQVLQ